MGSRRDLQFHALRPQRVIVVEPVHAERVEPEGCGYGTVGVRLDGAAHHALHHHRLQAQLVDRELELFDRFIGRVHGDGGHGHYAVLMSTEGISVHQVYWHGRRSGEARRPR